MQWRNTDSAYGWAAIFLHWLSAVLILALFGLGLWMVELNYYDQWYRQAPAIHKSVGILLFIIILFRWAWRMINPRPTPVGGPLERRLARAVHLLMYLILFATMIAGYLISTAEGRGIDVFDWFSVPATLSGLPHQEDRAGVVHLWLAWGLMVLAGGHTLAALKHHFLDRDATLKRMLWARTEDTQLNKGDKQDAT